ncbi:Mitochondrial ATPase complex subunit atp10 [Sorochytrium milnesiophthora]
MSVLRLLPPSKSARLLHVRYAAGTATRLCHRRFVNTTSENGQQPQSPAPPSQTTLSDAADSKTILERAKTTWTNLVDKDARLKRREVLKKEYQASYWKDLQELNATKGKLYTAPDQLVKPSHAVPVPELRLRPLNAASQNTEVLLTPLLNGKTTLLTLSMSAYGDEHVKSFVEPVLPILRDPKVPSLQHIQLNFAQGWMRSTIVKMSIPYIRRHVPAEEQPDYYLSLFHDVTQQLEVMQVRNKYLGWVFLVDAQGKIRWTAHGQAKPEEIERLQKFLYELSVSH